MGRWALEEIEVERALRRVYRSDAFCVTATSLPIEIMTTAAQSVSSGCWAAALGDCAQKITREHVVSQCLFEGDQIMVQGFKWCLKKPKSIGLATLSRRFCARSTTVVLANWMPLH